MDMKVVAFTRDEQATYAEYKDNMRGKMGRRAYENLVSDYSENNRIPGRAILCQQAMSVADALYGVEGHFVSCNINGVHVCCTHNGPPGWDDTDLPELETFLSTVHGPLVVTGDFNSTPGSRAMVQFGSSCHLTDLHAGLPMVTRFAYAVDNNKPGKRIDYLWYRGLDSEPLEVFAGFPDLRGHMAARQLIKLVGSDHHFVAGRFSTP